MPADCGRGNIHGLWAGIARYAGGCCWTPEPSGCAELGRRLATLAWLSTEAAERSEVLAEDGRANVIERPGTKTSSCGCWATADAASRACSGSVRFTKADACGRSWSDASSRYRAATSAL
jgi:hypothetical protein